MIKYLQQLLWVCVPKLWRRDTPPTSADDDCDLIDDCERGATMGDHPYPPMAQAIGSFVFGTPGFPLSDVPLQEIAQQVAVGRLKAKPARVFSFEEIREAHRLMEVNEAGGKIVVVLG